MEIRKKAGKKNKTPGQIPSLRTWICALIGGIFLGTAYQWGRQLDTAGNVNFTASATWHAALRIAAVTTPVLAWGFAVLQIMTSKETIIKPEECGFSRRRWLLGALGLFLCWIPVFLAVYPGFFAYDATDELQEVLSGSYVTRHPLLHVLLLGKTVAGIERLTGSYNFGIAAYVLAQMAAMAFLLSWVLESLKELGAGKLLRRFGFFFFALFPVIPMYVLCTSKDIWYTAGMLGVLVLLCKMEKDKDAFGGRAGNWAGMGAALFVMAVFRNNGFYVFLVMIPILLALAGKKCLKKMAVTVVLVLAVYFGTNGILEAALKPVSTDVQETLTVPIQQLARTWKYSPELFEAKDREALFEILPEEVLARYNPKLSDLVKIDFGTQAYLESPGRYRALWLRIGVKAPLTYINAWLMTSYGFWYPFTVIDVYNGSRYYTESSYFSCETEPPGWRHSFLKPLEKVYEEISWGSTVHRIPVLSWLFSPGFLCWVYVLAGLFLAASGRWQRLAVLAPVFLNWMTVLLGPTYLVRYVLIFWFALPVLLFTMKAPDGG